MTSQKSKKILFEEYIKNHQLEKLISELTNSLVHSLSPNPIVYMIKYLTGLLSDEEKTENNINIPPPYPEGVPIVKFPKFKSNNLLSKYLNKENWNDFKYIKTRYNNNINDLTILSENFPNDNIGICLCDDDCIISYDDLLNDLHKSAVVLGSHQAFCFPFYDYTEQSIKAVKEEGFKVAFIGESRKASRNDDKYKIPRYPIYDSTSMDSFKSMIG